MPSTRKVRTLFIGVVFFSVLNSFQITYADDCDLMMPINADEGAYCCDPQVKPIRRCDLPNMKDSCSYMIKSTGRVMRGFVTKCSRLTLEEEAAKQANNLNKEVKESGSTTDCPTPEVSTPSTQSRRRIRIHLNRTSRSLTPTEGLLSQEEQEVKEIFNSVEQSYLKDKSSSGELDQEYKNFLEDKKAFYHLHETVNFATDYPFLIGKPHLATLAAHLSKVFSSRVPRQKEGEENHSCVTEEGQKKDWVLFNGKGYPIDLLKEVVKYTRSNFRHGQFDLASNQDSKVPMDVDQKHYRVIDLALKNGIDFAELFRRNHGRTGQSKGTLEGDAAVQLYSRILAPYGCTP
jgi:hypothetical protein